MFRCTCRFDPAIPDRMDTVEVTARIKRALQGRTGTTWSVTRGHGTTSGWIHIQSPASRRDRYGSMSIEDQRILGEALDEKVFHQGVSVPASTAHYVEYIDRAEGRTPRRRGEAYWD